MCFVNRLCFTINSCEGVADTLSRIERGAFDFPEDPVISPEAKDFITRVRAQRFCLLILIGCSLC